MEQPKHTLKSGTRVRTHNPLGSTRSMGFTENQLGRRRAGDEGVILGVAVSSGGDVYWVKHDTSDFPAPYSFLEFELVLDGAPAPTVHEIMAERLFHVMSEQRTETTNKPGFPNLEDVALWCENWRKTHPETMSWHAEMVCQYAASFAEAEQAKRVACEAVPTPKTLSAQEAADLCGSKAVLENQEHSVIYCNQPKGHDGSHGTSFRPPRGTDTLKLRWTNLQLHPTLVDVIDAPPRVAEPTTELLAAITQPSPVTAPMDRQQCAAQHYVDDEYYHGARPCGLHAGHAGQHCLIYPGIDGRIAIPVRWADDEPPVIIYFRQNHLAKIEPL